MTNYTRVVPFVPKRPSKEYLAAKSVLNFCKRKNAVPSSLYEISLVRDGLGELSDADRLLVEQMYMRGRQVLMKGFEMKNGGLVGVRYFGSNHPKFAGQFAQAVQEYFSHKNKLLNDRRLVLPRNHPLAKALVRLAEANDAVLPCPAQNCTNLSLVAKGNNPSPFEADKAVALLYDGHPEGHAHHARKQWNRLELNVWDVTEADLTNYNLGKDLLEVRLSGVGGRGDYDDNVYAYDFFCDITGMLPVVHVGARNFPLETKVLSGKVKA